MRAFLASLFCSLAFAYVDPFPAPHTNDVLLETLVGQVPPPPPPPAAGCATDECRQFEENGKIWTRIYSCTNNVAKTPSIEQISALALTATQIRITRADGSYVTSNPESYPIQQLRLGQTISYNIGSGTTFGDVQTPQAVINANWQGSADLMGRLWQTCQYIAPVTTKFYHACNNQHGLHLGPNFCYWNYAAKYESPIQVYIDAGVKPAPTAPGCDTCRQYNGKSWTRVYHCNNTSTDGPTLSNADVIAAAQQATQVLITRNDGKYVVSNPGSYPIQQLRLGRTISYQLSPPASTIQVPPATVSSFWTGPPELVKRLWQTCSTTDSIGAKFFHACENQLGLHLASTKVTVNGNLRESQKVCMWDWTVKYAGVIEAFVDAPCSCSGDYNSYNSYNSYDTSAGREPR